MQTLNTTEVNDLRITDALHDYADDDTTPGANKLPSGKPGNGSQNPADAIAQAIAASFPSMPPEDGLDVPDLLINMNEKAKSYDKALFRDDILNKMLGVLHNLKHPNPLLIGEAGTGKTQIVEELARRIALEPDTLPADYRDLTIYELPISNLIAGGGMVGEIEARVKDVIEFASDPENKAIIYIDEIHQLYSKSSSTQDQIAQQLKPAMARGDLHIIASTTTQEGRRLKSDPAIQRRFNKINVPELNKEQTLEILMNVRKKFENHNQISIPKPILAEIVDMASEHMNSAMPDAALTLLDQASSNLYIQADALKKMMGGASTQKLKLTSAIVSQAVAQITSHKPSKIASKDALVADLQSVIKGQDEALEELSDALVRKQLNLIPSKQPLSFLLYGPTGTGKSEIAKQIAKNVFGSEKDMIYLNMTEFPSAATLAKLVGSPDGYVGSDSNQKLPFDILETNPAQVILLDEFEKAATEVQNFFMQALDEGVVSTQRGNSINFSKSIIIATSNAGQIVESTMGFGLPSDQDEKSKQLKSLSSDFKIELINRFKHAIRINSISKDDYRDIVKSKYNRIVTEIMENSKRRHFELVKFVDDKGDNVIYEFIEKIVDDSYSPELNGRPAERAVMKYIEDLVLENPDESLFEVFPVTNIAN